MVTDKRPADCLSGLDLGNGWVVKERIKPSPASTGGCFSVGYRAESAGGTVGFLKALDFSSAFQHPNFVERLQEMTTAYNFEKQLVLKCSGNNKVVSALASGDVEVSGGFGLLGRVCYIIFEWADKNDLRQAVSMSDSFDLAWSLRALHQAAVGLNRLHTDGIAHQDLKPSNLFCFSDDVVKIGDLGCASDREIPSPNDHYFVPGDPTYAPPEQLYGFRHTGDFNFRFAADLYLLGSLFFFYFLQVSATTMLRHSVQRLGFDSRLGSDFDQDVVLLKRCFGDSLEVLREAIHERGCRDLTPRILRAVGEMCDPDPRTRGFKKIGNTLAQRYSIQRYASIIENFAMRAEMNMS